VVQDGAKRRFFGLKIRCVGHDSIWQMPYTDSGLWVPRDPERSSSSPRNSTYLAIASLLVSVASMATSAFVSYQAIDINRRTFSLQHRPKLLITEAVKYIAPQNGQTVIALTLRNLGDSDAKIEHVFPQLDKPGTDLSLRQDAFTTSYLESQIVGTARPAYIHLSTPTKADYDDTRLFGFLSYTDAYGADQPFYGFCFVFGKSAQDEMHTSEGNACGGAQ
jgi:hypothetical protein